MIAGTARKPVSIWDWPRLAQCVHLHRRTKAAKPPRLRKHAPAILAWAYRQRYTTSDQIGRRFRRFMPSDRTVRRHLAELVELGLLTVQPITGLPTFSPKVYSVTATGRQLLKKAYAKQGIAWQEPVGDRRRNEGVSLQHVWHELAITEVCLLIHESVESSTDFQVLEMERRSLLRHEAFQFGFRGRRARLTADAMFMYRTPKGMMVNFLEVDTGTESEAVLRNKLQRYRVWSESSEGQQYVIGLYCRHGATNPRAVFRLLFIVTANTEQQEQNRLRLVIELTRQYSPDLARRLWICSGRDLAHGMTAAPPLQQPVWICARDVLAQSARRPFLVVPRSRRRSERLRHRLDNWQSLS